MFSFLLNWLPVIFTLPVVLTGMNKKRFAIPLILILYFGTLLTISILPHLIEMTETGSGDPQLVAGAISGSLVTGMLVSIIQLPVIFIAWFFIRRAKIKKTSSL